MFAHRHRFTQTTPAVKAHACVAPSQLYIAAEMLLWILFNVLLVLCSAIVPPVEAAVERWQTCREEAARDQALKRNELCDEKGDSDCVVTLQIDGTKVGYYFTGWSQQLIDQELQRFERKRREVAEREAALSRRHFPLFQPACKFWLHVSCRLLFATLLVVAEDLPSSELGALAFLLVWGVQLVAWEAVQLLSVLNSQVWLLDALNPLMLTSSALAVVGLSICVWHVPAAAVYTDGVSISERHESVSRPVIAISIVLMFMSQSLCILQRLPRFGPMVMMTQLMVGDVVSFLVLISGTVIGFAAAFSTLVRGQSFSFSDEWEDSLYPCGCL